MVTIFCMKIGPWNPICTIIPLALPLVVLVVKVLHKRQLPEAHRVQLGTALVALACAVVCFKKGLDDENDYLRLWHGFWHVFSSVFTFFAIKSNSKFDKRRMRLMAEGFGDMPWAKVRPGMLLGLGGASSGGGLQNKSS
jgi:hypothetical protein